MQRIYKNKRKQNIKNIKVAGYKRTKVQKIVEFVLKSQSLCEKNSIEK